MEQQLPCFLSLSLCPESIELEFHVQSKFGCYNLQQAGRQYPPSAERCGPDWISDLQPARLLPSPSLREFLCRVLFLPSTLHQEPASWVQPGIIAPALCLLGGQAAVLWLKQSSSCGFSTNQGVLLEWISLLETALAFKTWRICGSHVFFSPFSFL